MLELRNIHKYYNPGTVNEMLSFEGLQSDDQSGRICIRSRK